MARLPNDGAPLTRVAIVKAAVRYADAGRLSDLTIRALATDLGVSPMALYRHVLDKDDLLLAVIDTLLGRDIAPDPSLDWAAYLRAHAISLRSILRREPALAALYGRRPVTTPAAVARLSVALEVLGRSGFPREPAVRAFAAVHTYTLGFGLLETARASSGLGHSTTPTDTLAGAIEGFVSEEQFLHGLDAVIGGLTPANTPRD